MQTVILVATAHPDTLGEQGPPQARAAVSQALHRGRNNSLSLTMESTLADVVITPDSLALLPGAERMLTAAARDAEGNVVLTSDSWEWTRCDPSVASVDAAGRLVAVASGDCTVKASEAETGESG